MTAPATIAARGLRKGFGAGSSRVEVLAGVDLDVAPGQTYALLGPSGCGKSTLLRILAGFDAPDSGEVRLAGEPVRAPSPRLGMVAQAGGLFPWPSLRDNLAYGPREAGRDDADASSRGCWRPPA